MKLRIKGSAKGQFMKKLLLTCILIVGIVFIAGCIGEEKTDAGTPASSQISQESDTQTTGSILKPSDVPGLTLDPNHVFWAVPKNTLYVCGNESDREGYKDTLPIGYRNVGEDLQWNDKSGREMRVILTKYDSNPSTVIEYITNLKSTSIEEFIEEGTKFWGEPEPGIDLDLGDPHIGDCSVYWTHTDTNTDIQITNLFFVYKNNYAVVAVTDEKGKSKKEAIRIAKVIKSRLD